MDISNTIAVTGTIAAKESRSVSTLVSDTKVLSVSVNVGDYVNAGDPICTFDTTNIEDKITALKKQMSIAEAKAEISVAEANTTLAQDVQDNTTTVSRNQESVSDAWQDYYNACDGYNAAKQAKSDAETAMNNAENDYNSAKAKYDALPDEFKAGTWTVSSGSADYSTYQSYTNISKDYSYYKGIYETAKSTYESAVNKCDSYSTSIDNAESALEKAGETLSDSQLQAGRTYTKDNVNVYSTGLDASTTNDSNETQLEEYEEELADCTVVAPISGLVTSVSVEVGDEYTEQSEICVIQDDTGYIVEGTVDQYDISSISENMTAVVKTDATGDDEMSGIVTFVSPVPESSTTTSSTATGSSAGSSSSSSSSTDYPIEITLTDRDDRLRIGMTAETSVITEQAKDVLAVPYDCVQTDADGNSVIYVADKSASGNAAGIDTVSSDGANSGNRPKSGGSMPTGNAATKAIVVTTGLETDYYTEIESDQISEGMQVLVPNSISTTSGSSTTQDNSSAFSFGLGGGGNQGGGSPSGGGGAPSGGPGGGGF